MKAYTYRGTEHELERVGGSMSDSYRDTKTGKYYDDMHDGRLIEDTKPSGAGETLYLSDPAHVIVPPSFRV